MPRALHTAFPKQTAFDHRVVLDVPFFVRGGSTPLTELSVSDRQRFVEAIECTILESEAPSGAPLRYATLSQDDEQRPFIPIFAWSVNLAALSSQKPATHSPIQIEQVEVDIFPNDLGIIRISLSTTLDPRRIERDELELFESDSSIIAKLLYEFLDQRIQTCRGKLGIKSEELGYRPGILWSSRIFIVDRSDCSEDLIDRLAIAGRSHGDRPGASHVIGEGNSVFCDDGAITFSQFLKCFHIAQIYFALNDNASRRLSAIYQDAGRAGSGRQILEVEGRLNAVSTGTRLLHLDFHDAKRGLQAERKWLLEDIITAWRITDLSDSVSARDQLTTQFVANLVTQRNAAQRASIEAGVIIIGGFAILQFILDFWHYAEERKDSGALGLIYFAQKVSVEFVLVGALVILLALGLFRSVIRR